MRIVKESDSRHGPVYGVYTNGVYAGSVEKWHGLFLAKDGCDMKISLRLHDRRQDAAQEVVDSYLEGFER